MAPRKEDSRGRRRSRSRDRRVSVDNRRCSVGNRRMATAGNHRRTAQGRSASRGRTAGGQQSMVRGVRTQRRVAASRAAVEPLPDERQRSSTNSLIQEQNAAQRWFQVINQEDVRGVRQQYAIDLQQYKRPGGKYEAFNRVEGEALGLNRYEDVQLLDHSRVVLRRAGGIDYIHASHVHGGPFPMICDRSALPVRRGWAEKMCRLLSPGEIDQIWQRHSGTNEPDAGVAHFRFDGWPDHDVPDNPASFRQFRLAILRQAIEKKCTYLFLHRAVIDAAVVAGKLEQATVEPFLAEYEKVVKRKRREAAEQYEKHKAEHDAKKN
uniref:Tyrosine-protein phosphatase domain-containing protein n=1 Tax=Meloidogyne floridensis TaxID=298350 RepID=A0A915NVK3_9BILA